MTKTKDDNTEQRILDAAKEVFIEYGFYGARMQDIANKAGINKALLHYYFRSKDRLFDEIFEGALSRYFEQMVVLTDDSVPILDRLDIYADRIIRFFSEYPMMTLFIIKEIGLNPDTFHDKVKEFKRPGKSLMEIVQDEADRGNIEAVNPVIFVMNLHSLCVYPFLGQPLFKVMVNRSEIRYSYPEIDELIASVKSFIHNTLTKKQ